MRYDRSLVRLLSGRYLWSIFSDYYLRGNEAEFSPHHTHDFSQWLSFLFVKPSNLVMDQGPILCHGDRKYQDPKFLQYDVLLNGQLKRWENCAFWDCWPNRRRRASYTYLGAREPQSKRGVLEWGGVSLTGVSHSWLAGDG